MYGVIWEFCYKFSCKLIFLYLNISCVSNLFEVNRYDFENKEVNIDNILLYFKFWCVVSNVL